MLDDGTTKISIASAMSRRCFWLKSGDVIIVPNV